MQCHNASEDTPVAAHRRRKAPSASQSVRGDVRPPILFSPLGHDLVAMRYSSEAIDQYLRHLRKAEEGLSGMNTTQARDLVEHRASSNGLGLFRQHFSRLLHICGGAPVGFPVQDAVVGVSRMAGSAETVGHMDHERVFCPTPQKG